MVGKKASRRHYFRIVVEIMVLAIFLLPSIGMVRAGTGTLNNLQDTQLPDALQMPGRLEANGTHFELTNRSYLNITLDSSEPINLTLESASGNASTQINLSGFLPLTTYHNTKMIITITLHLRQMPVGIILIYRTFPLHI